MAYGDIINSPHIANSQYREKNGVDTINTAVLLKDTASPMGGLGINHLNDSLNLEQLAVKASNRAGLYVGIQGSVCVLPSGQSQIIAKAKATATTTNKLVANSKDFNSEGVQIRDIVVNTTDNTLAFVAAIDNASTLSLVDIDGANLNIMATGENFEIYRAVIFQNVQAGTFIPIQVDRVFRTGTTADEIIAIY